MPCPVSNVPQVRHDGGVSSEFYVTNRLLPILEALHKVFYMLLMVFQVGLLQGNGFHSGVGAVGFRNQLPALTVHDHCSIIANEGHTVISPVGSFCNAAGVVPLE